MANPELQEFTTGELQVMKILWEQGELKPAEIQEYHPLPIKNPALRSYLSILCEKGHVTRRKIGKAYFYKAKTRQRKAWQNQVGNLVETYFNGSVSALVMNLVQSEKLSAEDLAALKAYAEKKENQ